MSTQPVFGSIPIPQLFEPYYGLNVLTCFIVTGDYDPNNPDDQIAENNNKYIISETVEVTIKDSYKTLINTATVTLPREIFTIIGDKDENGDRERPAFGDLGIFKRDNRIRILLGYDENYKVMFDGFIRTIDPKSPFTLHCEDFAYILKKTNVGKTIQTYRKIKEGEVAPIRDDERLTNVNFVLKPLIEKSGIPLNKDTIKSNIQLSKMIISKNRSVASVLEEIKRRFGILAFVKTVNGLPTIAMSRSFFSSRDDGTTFDGESAIPTTIDFRYNVVSDNIVSVDLDYKNLAVVGTLRLDNGDTYKETIIANPNYDKERSAWEADNSLPVPDEFKSVNTEVLTKKQAKSAYDKAKETNNYYLSFDTPVKSFDLSGYDVRSYNGFEVDSNTFRRDMKDYFKTLSKNGIEGDITIFGDFGIKSATMVELYDHRNPEKNGTYIVETVVTKFGVNGYRQTLTLPYKRSKSYNSVR